MPFCRICNRKEKPAFGTGPRKPLANPKRDQTRMSADAQVQPEVAGGCLLLGFMPGECGRPNRCHIISQELLRDTYQHGAYRVVGEEFWRPTPRYGIPAEMADCAEQITAQQIHDDARNLVEGCENHNKDGLEMVEALDRRKVAGLVAYPPGFGVFAHEFRFSIEGSIYWYYVRLEVAA